MFPYHPSTSHSRPQRIPIYSVAPAHTTTVLLQPYYFDPNEIITGSFYYFEDPVNASTSLLRPGFHASTVVSLTGFHYERDKKYWFPPTGVYILDFGIT